MTATKSEIIMELAHEMGWKVHDIKLIDNGPEFEVVGPKHLTYEQAIVSMYREAQSILAQGEKLKQDVFVKRHEYFYQSIALRMRRAMRVQPASSPTKAYLVKQSEQRVLRALDKLWEAQEKYNSWAKLYGDI